MAETSPEKLLERLAKGKLAGAVVLEGGDVYLRDLCRNKIIDSFVPEGSRDWGVARLSAREDGWEAILERASTLPMFAPRQVVIVSDAGTLEKLGEDRREKILKSLEDYLENPSSLTILILEAEALDGRQKFSKVLHQRALVVALTIGAESASALASQMAKELGVALDPDAASLLADILNSEPARIHIELEKLAAYAGETRRITRGDIEALVVAARKNTVWQLADMIATRNRAAAFAFLENLLREGDEPIAIVGALAWMYRKLIEARALPSRTPGYQAARVLSMRPEAAEAAVRNAHRLSKKELLESLGALAEADSQLKLSNPNPRAFMEFLLARLTSSARAA